MKKQRKKKLSNRTRLLLQLVINQLQENPTLYYQDALHMEDVHTCKSPMCITGWFDAFAKALGWEIPEEMRITGNGGSAYKAKHTTLRGRLYWQGNWPKAYQDGSEDRCRDAKVAIRRIKRFLSSDGTK